MQDIKDTLSPNLIFKLPLKNLKDRTLKLYLEILKSKRKSIMNKFLEDQNTEVSAKTNKNFKYVYFQFQNFMYQVMIMIEQKKIYLGSIKTEMEAARYYDIITIISMGMGAKTNFSYTKA